MKRKSFLKKSTAAATAAILCVSAAPASVFAADAYTESAKTSISKMAESFAADYQKSFDEYDEAKNAQTANWTLTLGETSVALLGQLLGMDMSWFQNVKILQNQGIGDNGIYISMELQVNDTKAATLEMLMDTQTSDVYMRVPEISDAYLLVSAEQMEESSGSLSTMNPDEILKSLPEASVIKDLLNKYGAMLVANMEDQEAASNTLTVGDVSQECTMLEGILSQEQAKNTLVDILKEVKEDEQIKSILDSFSQFAEGEDLSAAFTQEIDNALEDLENGSVSDSLEDLEEEAQELTEEAVDEAVDEFSDEINEEIAEDEAEDVIILDEPVSPLDGILEQEDSYLSAKMWVDENDELIGQQFAFCSADGETIVPFLTYQSPSAEGKSGLLFSISDGLSGFTFSGSGDVTDNVLNGTYALTVDDIPVLSVAVSDYLTDSEQTDKSSGTYTISLAEWSEDLASIIDEGTYGFLSTFGIVFGYESEGTAGGFDLSLTTSGMNLGTLSMTADVSEEELEIPDPSTFETVYNAESDEDMEAYLSTADVEGLLNSFVNAGVPEEFIIALMSGGSEDDEYYDDEYYDEYYDDEYYDDEYFDEYDDSFYEEDAVDEDTAA